MATFKVYSNICCCVCRLRSVSKMMSKRRFGMWNTNGNITVDVGLRPLKLSCGKFARFADGSAVAEYGDTSVMVTAVSRQKPSPGNFVPLTVDFRQKAAAAGRIPTNFLRRELAQSDREILTSRLIDRSLRPLFPPGFCYETQIICNLLAVDGDNDPDVISINAASAALSVSDIPWDGPIGAVRVGLIDNEVIVNPTRRQLGQSQLNLVVAGTRDSQAVMLEGSANNVYQQDLRKAIKQGLREAAQIARHTEKLAESAGRLKRSLPQLSLPPKELVAAAASLGETRLRDIYSDASHDKISRDAASKNVREDLTEKLTGSFPEADAQDIQEAISVATKDLFRSLIFDTDTRCDGRGLRDIRPLRCEADLFPPLHGSALFQRGQTQVMCTVALDSPDSAAKLDPVSTIISGVKEKNFFLHYEFPPYATNEIGRHGVGRREIGHGALAERGLRPLIPAEHPFTIRLSAEVLESNGSSSMASVCAGCMALMDAGVKLSEPVSGVAIGMVTRTAPENSDEREYKILTDILGIEDYMGDMDFKVAGTSRAITALQADVKSGGLNMKQITEVLESACDANRRILQTMREAIASPRSTPKPCWPVSEQIEIEPHRKAKFIGFGGQNVRRITSETGVSITQEEGNTYHLFASNQTAMDEAKDLIEELIKEDPEPMLEFGAIYTGRVLEVVEHGVLLELHPRLQPVLLHNSQLDLRKVQHASAIGIEVGQDLQVKYFGRDPVNGRIRVSRKALLAPATAVIKNLNK